MADKKQDAGAEEAEEATPAEAPAGAKKVKKAAADRSRVAAVANPPPKDYVPRLRKHYDEVVRKALTEKFGYKNAMQVPQLDKIVLNMGIGEATQDSKLVQIGRRRTREDRRPEGGDHQVEEGDRAVQDPREPGDRRARSRCARRACTSSSTG